MGFRDLRAVVVTPRHRERCSWLLQAAAAGGVGCWRSVAGDRRPERGGSGEAEAARVGGRLLACEVVVLGKRVTARREGVGDGHCCQNALLLGALS